VLFGGSTAQGIRLNDTWEWDGATWTQRMPQSIPPARRSHAAAYDAARGRVVVFGGNGSGGALADTWEWNGTDWTSRSPATSPFARDSHALAYDAARQCTVLFGGVTPS